MKKFMAMAMAMAMTAAMGTSAFAADAPQTDRTEVNVDGGQGSAVAVLNVEPATFSVMVPDKLYIYVDADGVVTTPTNTSIVNMSAGAVDVKGLAITGTNSWATADWDTSDMSAEPVNTKKIALELNGEKTTGADTNSFDQANFPTLSGENDTDSDELPITYNAKVPGQASEIVDANVADIMFTIGWHLAE